MNNVDELPAQICDSCGGAMRYVLASCADCGPDHWQWQCVSACHTERMTSAIKAGKTTVQKLRDTIQELRNTIQILARTFDREDNCAFDLWTWLPSYKISQKYHRDNAPAPSVAAILEEATFVMSEHAGYKHTDVERAEFLQCSCGEGCEREDGGRDEEAPVAEEQSK